MKNEKFLSAMENINDELILSAMEEPAAAAKIKPFARIKWSVLAACLALVLAVPAVASVLGFRIDFNQSDFIWNAKVNGKFAVSEFSEKVQNLSEDSYFARGSLLEAEALLGISLPDNAVLDNSEMGVIVFEDASGKQTKGSCGIMVSYNEEKLRQVLVQTGYGVGENSVSLWYAACTEECKYYENEEGYVDVFGFVIEEPTSREKYTTSSGRECELLFTFENGRYCAVAFTECNRILVALHVGGTDRDSVRATAVEILEAYN